MSGPEDHHYTNLPNGINTPSSARIVGENNFEASQQQVKKTRDLSKLSNLGLLVAVVLFIGSIAFAIQRTTTGTKTRADTNAAAVVDNGTADTLLKRDLLLTDTIKDYPKSYKGKAIDAKLISEGQTKYKDFSPDLQKQFIINRLILYYALSDVLKENSITEITSDIDFEAVNGGVKAMRRTVREKLLTTADYVYIKANFSQNRGYEGQALETIKNYHDKLAANPDNFQGVLKEANEDVFLRQINHGEMNDVVYNYVDDDNDVSEQTNFIFDQDFDNVLFRLPVRQVSDIITLNSETPYMYVVTYPIRIETKKYKKTSDIIKEKLSSFTF